MPGVTLSPPTVRRCFPMHDLPPPVRPLARAGYLIAALTLALGAATLTKAEAAGLQPSPAPTLAPAGTPSTGTKPVAEPASEAGVPAQRIHGSEIGHLPVIDIAPIFTEPAFYSQPSQVKDYDPLDVGGSVKFPVTRTFSLSFDRNVGGTVNQPLGRQYDALGNATYPKVTRDAVLVYRGDLQLHQFTLEAGESFRHRIFASGSPIVSAQPFPATYGSQEHHFAYLGVTYTTPPIAALGGTVFAFNITGDAQNVDHHVGAMCTAALASHGTCTTPNTIYYVDEAPGQNRWYETTQSVGMTIPVDRKHGFSFTAKDTWGYLNFYENSPWPGRYSSAVLLQVTKKFSPLFSLAMRVQNNNQSFPNPQLHVGSIDVIGDFHLDLNAKHPFR